MLRVRAEPVREVDDPIRADGPQKRGLEDGTQVRPAAPPDRGVLVAGWAPGTTASKSVLAELAKAFVPRPKPEAQ